MVPSKAVAGEAGALTLPLPEEDRAVLVEAKSFEGQERMKNSTRQALFNVSSTDTKDIFSELANQSQLASYWFCSHNSITNGQPVCIICDKERHQSEWNRDRA